MIALPFASPVIVCTDRSSWLAARRGGIGASENAALFGEGYRNQSPLTVWDSKVNVRDDDGDEDDDDGLWVGREMEPLLRKLFHRKTGLHCESPGEFTIYKHPEIDYLRATLDGICIHPEFGPIPVELKNVRGNLWHQWEGDKLPLKFEIQVNHQMLVAGTRHAYAIGLIGGCEPAVRLVERNDAFIAAMLPKLEEFWGYVTRREMPPIDGSEGTTKILRLLHPKDNGEKIELGDEFIAIDEERMQAAEAEKAAKAIKDRCSNQIRAAIGHNSYGLLPNGTLYSWNHSTTRAHYVKESESRTLLRRK